MKSFIFVILTSVWLTGILAPPVLLLLDVTKPFISINLNEEEPQKVEKKEQGEEKILTNFKQDSSHNGNIRNRLLFSDLSKNVVNHSTEILLPPPEYNS